MEIGGRTIGGRERPFIVAEISGNHGGTLRNAITLIQKAKASGADAVKTQCFNPDSMTMDCKKIDFIVQDGLWAGRSLYELYTAVHTPPEWHPDLYKAAADAGIMIFSSVFDVRDLDFLEKLNPVAYKIASFEIVDLPLLETVASTNRPLVISTGLATNKEVLDAATIVGGDVCFLHCTSGYPSTALGAGLDRIGALNALLDYKYPIGLSDHTKELVVPVAATAKKAAIIEKHLKLKGVASEDEEFSLTPEEFKLMTEAVAVAHAACRYDPPVKSGLHQFRRSLYASQDIAEGEPITMSNVRSIRPGFGLPPKELPAIIGQPSKRAFKRGDAIK